jgi:transposase
MVTMNQKEFQRVKVIENAAGGRLSVGEASRLLQLSERQVQRLKSRYRPDSVGWVQQGNRGRSMPWAVSLPRKQLILTLARGKYQGFNDSHLTEKLHSRENLFLNSDVQRAVIDQERKDNSIQNYVKEQLAVCRCGDQKRHS